MSVPRIGNELTRWRRNLVAVVGATFIGFMSFTLVMPFLPLYFEQLGTHDLGEIALWAGLSLGITPLMTALCAPFWGRLADRFGRKLMVLRSLFSFVIIMAATAYVTAPWQVFALRLLQGFFAGYGAMAIAMAAESAPPGRMATSIGAVQGAQRLGPAFGPVVGGALAELVGLRNAFLVSALFYLIGFTLVLVAYKESRDARAPRSNQPAPGTGTRSADGDELVTFKSVLALQNFILLMVVLFGMQFAERSIGPILPLHIGELGVPDARVPLVAGILFSLVAGAGAFGNIACARLLSIYSARTVMAMSALIAAAGAAVAALGVPPLVLGVAMTLFGLGLGAGSTAAYTAAGSVIPTERRGSGFSLLTSASLLGMAFSPMTCGLLGAVSIRAVFVLDAVLLLLLAIFLPRVMVERGGTESPTLEDG